MNAAVRSQRRRLRHNITATMSFNVQNLGQCWRRSSLARYTNSNICRWLLPLDTTLRVHFLQHRFDCSDPQTEVILDYLGAIFRIMRAALGEDIVLDVSPVLQIVSTPPSRLVAGGMVVSTKADQGQCCAL